MADNQIAVLKNLFSTFFSKMTLKYWEDNAKRDKRNLVRTGGSGEILTPAGKQAARAAWIAYTDNSKSTVLGLSATVTSLAGVIGQPGISAFNVWIATYAGGTGALTQEAVKALQAWYNQYLNSLK
jgi:hypothetical protein